MVLSGPFSVLFCSRRVCPFILILPAAPWPRSKNGEPVVQDIQASHLEVPCGGDSAPRGHVTTSQDGLVVLGVGVPVAGGQACSQRTHGASPTGNGPPAENGPPRSVQGGGRGPALEPGEGEAGFEAGALASELRLVHSVDPLRAGWPGSPVHRVLFLASLTSQPLLRSTFCMQGAKVYK